MKYMKYMKLNIACAAFAMACVVVSAVFLYFGVTDFVKTNDERYIKITLEKLSSEPVCNTKECDVADGYKNRYRHVECENHSIESPYLTFTKLPGPEFATMMRHKQNRTCEPLRVPMIPPTISVSIAGVFIILSVAFIGCAYYARSRKVILNVPKTDF